MTMRSGFFNSVNGDRVYKAESFAEYFSTFISNGVFPNPSTGLQVMQNAGMSVAVRPGKGWINGYYVINDDNYVLNLDVAEGILKRIDRIVLRLDYITRSIIVYVSKGTPASTPQANPLQRDEDAYEIALADIYINNGITNILQSAITDTRLNDNLCGIVHGLVNQVDTTTIYNQYLEWFKDVKASNTEEIDNYIATEKNKFEEWFNSLQVILQDDVATNLANHILTVENRLSLHMGDINAHGIKKWTEENAQITKITKNEGSAKIFLTSSGDNILQSIIADAPGYGTFYAGPQVPGKPYTQPIRGHYHLDTEYEGWVIAFDVNGKMWTNRLEMSWGGWKEIYSTGGSWANLPLQNGVKTYGPTQMPQYKKVGDMVYLRGAVKNLRDINIIIGTLPVEFRPKDQLHSFMQNTSQTATSARFARWTVSTLGEIKLENITDSNNLNSDMWFPIATSFLVN
ncbi:hypothetical protein [Cytobacillus horneckiae]|uniref:hypothetical protein n=1 Tax=Cytobacillus horneckiae TaxID=549687 RepID=UPI003D1A162F